MHRAIGILFAAALLYANPAATRQLVDLELVLAVDISSSVSTEEFNLQMGGLANAFRDPLVAAAIRASGDLGIAVSLIQWSDNRRQFLAVDWDLLHYVASSRHFADQIAAAARLVVAGGGTAIGGALKYGTAQIESNDYDGLRLVIDVSGDGRTNQGWPDRPLRDATVARGISINGLVILNEEPLLDDYYHANVIGGAGAFVMTTMDFHSFASAILAKLIREIAGAPVASLEETMP
jgi:hypothetical protein